MKKLLRYAGWSVAGHALTIPTDSLAIAWGRHIATAIARCNGCHTPDLGGDPRAVALPRDRAAQTFRHAIANCTVVIVDSRSFRSLTS